MARHIHVHVHDAADDPDGKWVTINGAHVFVGKGGKIEKGPAALVGKTEGEASGKGGSGKSEEKGTSLSAARVNAGKYNSLKYAQQAQAESSKPTQVLLHKESGQYHVPASAKQAQLLRETGEYDVHLDYNGKPPEGEASEKKDAPKEKKPSKAMLMKEAKEEHQKANRGEGSYYKAAQLYEQSGNPDKAAGMHALARRYGHDPEGQKRKAQADLDAAQTSRAQALRAPSTKVRSLLLKHAELHEARAKDPESNEISAQLRDLNDELAFEESKGDGDLDTLRAAIRKEKPDAKPDEINEEIDRRLRSHDK